MDTVTAEKADLAPENTSGSALVEHQPAPTAAGGDAPLLALISRAASDPRVDMDKFERLLAMQEKLAARAAMIAFNAAFADAKSEIDPVVRNAKGHNDKMFADLSAISKAVDHILGKHGLSYRFRTSQAATISVTCILSHKDGHSEENTLSGPADKTGNKNEVQAIGSTQKYLMRYTLEGALGLSTTAEDDGKAVGGKVPNITEEQAAQLREFVNSTKTDEAKMLEGYGCERIEDLSLIQFGEVRILLEQKLARLAKASAAGARA